MLSTIYSNIVNRISAQCKAFCGERLIGFSVCGSVARGTLNNHFDIDFLFVEEDSLYPRVKGVVGIANGAICGSMK